MSEKPREGFPEEGHDLRCKELMGSHIKCFININIFIYITMNMKGYLVTGVFYQNTFIILLGVKAR
jgi:hypothetical protein